MFDRLDSPAQRVLERAQHEARQLGHHYVGTEHLLLALADEPPIAALLTAHGCGPSEVRGEIVSLIGEGDAHRPGSDTLLANLGIDIGEVRRRAESTFGADAITRAALAMRPRRRRWPGSRWWPGCDVARPCPSTLIGGNWLAMAPRLKRVLQIAVGHSGPQPATPTHLLLAILEEGQGVACQILARRNVDLAALGRAATVA